MLFKIINLLQIVFLLQVWMAEFVTILKDFFTFFSEMASDICTTVANDFCMKHQWNKVCWKQEKNLFPKLILKPQSNNCPTSYAVVKVSDIEPQAMPVWRIQNAPSQVSSSAFSHMEKVNSSSAWILKSVYHHNQNPEFLSFTCPTCSGLQFLIFIPGGLFNCK